MKWEQLSPYCLRSGPWFIAKVIVKDIPRYELRKENGAIAGEFRGSYPTAELAKEHAND